MHFTQGRSLVLTVPNRTTAITSLVFLSEALFCSFSISFVGHLYPSEFDTFHHLIRAEFGMYKLCCRGRIVASKSAYKIHKDALGQAPGVTELEHIFCGGMPESVNSRKFSEPRKICNAEAM